jgi:hypothetical protein
VTVNFEHAGKLLINASRVALEIVDEGETPHPLAPPGDAGPNA